MAKLRKLREKMDKDRQAMQQLAHQQKQSQFEDYSKKYKYEHDLKEDHSEEDDSHLTHSSLSKSRNSQHSSPNHNASSKSALAGTQFEDISVDQLVQFCLKLIDEHNKLQSEAQQIQHQLAEQQLIYEDKITRLEQSQPQHTADDFYDGATSDEKDQSAPSVATSRLQREFEEKIQLLTSRHDATTMALHDKYTSEADGLRRELKSIKKDLADADKENEALRTSLEAVEHENQSLRVSLNNQHKQFANIKLVQNRNKQLSRDLDALRTQYSELERDMVLLMQEQEEMEQQQQQVDEDRRQSGLAGMGGSTNQMMNTGHRYQNTLMGGLAMDTSSAKMSDHSNVSNDLLHQIGDYDNGDGGHDYDSNTPERFGSGVSHRSGTPGTGTGTGDAERDSNYGGYQEELDQDDEKKTREQSAANVGSRSASAGAVQSLQPATSAVERLAKFKDLGDMNPDSMAQIARLLQEKEMKRLGQSLGQRSDSRQQIGDTFSVESNYSDSEQGVAEQIDGLEDEVRDLKEMVQSLMDATNNLQPQLAGSLGPLARKVNRMYVMLSGPQMMDRGYSYDGREEDKESESASEDGYAESASTRQRMLRKRRGSRGDRGGGGVTWYAWLGPMVADWMPSIGFSAMLLSTMYLLMQYRKGRMVAIGIGAPRVLRNAPRN